MQYSRIWLFKICYSASLTPVDCDELIIPQNNGITNIPFAPPLSPPHPHRCAPLLPPPDPLTHLNSLPQI